MKALNQSQKDFLKKPIIGNISVINELNSLPIVFPAWVLENNNKLYISTSLQSKKVSHLAKNNIIGLAIVDPKGHPYIGISGKTSFINQNDEPTFSNLRNMLLDKYDIAGEFRKRMQSSQNQLERILIEIEPEIIYGSVT